MPKRPEYRIKRGGEEELPDLVDERNIPHKSDEQVLYFEDLSMLLIWGDITTEVSRQVCCMSLSLGSDIKRVMINSRGGEVNEGLAIADILSGLNVDTIGIGQLYSMGCYLFSMGKRRLVLPSTSFLIHAGSVFIGETNYNVIKSFQEFWSNQVQTNLLDGVLRKTNIRNKTKFRNDIMAGREYYFNAVEAVKIRLATHCISFEDLLKGRI